MNPARLALYYAAYFAVVGILLPFWPVWLSSKGLSPVEIGMVLAAAPFVRGLTNPLIAQYADRRGIRQPLMVGLAGLAALSFALYGLAESFWPILVISVLFFMFWSSTQPLGESLTMHIVRQENANYGRIRLWGSITFILTAVIGGRVLEQTSPSAIFTLCLAGIVILFGVCLILPRSRMQNAGAARWPLVPLLKSKPLLLMLCAAAMIQSSHAVVYGFGTIHWQKAGYSETVIGLFWALGVIAEIILFQFSKPVLKRISPAGLIALGAAAGLVRWTITGTTDALIPLLIAQVLHGLTFGATHLGAVHYISDNVPPSLSATAQSLLSAAVMGIAIGSATLASGALYEAAAGQAFHAMTVLALIGGVFAVFLMRSGGTGLREEEIRP